MKSGSGSAVPAALAAAAAAAARVVLVLGVASAAGCAAEATARRGQVVMGTVLEVTVVAADEARAARLADAAIDEARRWDDALTIWRADGELARLNDRAGSGWLEVGDRLARGLAAMQQLAAETGGAFEPATAATPRGGCGVPAARPAIATDLELDGDQARLACGRALDPGAIGKGLALDAMSDALRRGGAGAAFLDFGGSSQTAVGAPPGNARGWPLLLAGWEEGSHHGILRLRDRSLSTSRAGALDTVPVADRRAGRPVRGRRLATVLCPGATPADAWSTALVVLGRRGLPQVADAGCEALLEDESSVARSAGFPANTPPVAPAGPEKPAPGPR